MNFLRGKWRILHAFKQFRKNRHSELVFFRSNHVPGTGHYVNAGFLLVYTLYNSDTLKNKGCGSMWLCLLLQSIHIKTVQCLTSCRSRQVKNASSSLWRQLWTKSCLVVAVTHACWHFSDWGKGQQARPDQFSPLLISGTKRWKSEHCRFGSHELALDSQLFPILQNRCIQNSS